MSIASQITALGNNIGAAYNMIGQRGGTIPARKNAENMATAIATIPSGSCPPQKDYGTLTYQPIITTGATVAQQSKTGTFYWSVPNTKKFLEAVRDKLGLKSNSDGTFSCTFGSADVTSDAKWYLSRYIFDGSTRTFTLAELSDIFGITISGVANTGNKSLTLKITASYDTATTIDVTDIVSYESLGGSVRIDYNSFGTNQFVKIGDTYIYKNQITGYSFGTDCDFIPGEFLYLCYRLTSLYGLEDLTVTEISDFFLGGCNSFNQQLVLPSTVTRIGGSFLSGCSAFNQPIDLLNVTLIGPLIAGNADFLSSCTAFNSTITAPKLEKFEGGNQGFLSACVNYNQPVNLPKLKTVPSSFLYNCTSFNQTISLPEAESIGSSFLRNCSVFNQPLVLPNTLTSIGLQFMYGCPAFNQPLTIPSSVTTIGTYFMYQCFAFNQPLTLPSSLTTIPDSFMRNCSVFDQPLTIPSTVTSIGTYFMSYCGFSQSTITIPSSVTSIGGYFLYQCNGFTGILDVATSVSPTDNYSLSTSTVTAPCYTTGITVKGSQRSTWITNLPDRTSSPYRKLIDGGAS